jgi:Clp amino terminal domain, pathogenicity island component
MQLANQEAQRFNHKYIGTEHVLLGLIKEGSGVAANVLKNVDIDLLKIRLEVEKLVQIGPDMVTIGRLPQTPRATNVIKYSLEEARDLNHNYIGTEHILLGLLREEEGIAGQVLTKLGLKLDDARASIVQLLNQNCEGGGPPFISARLVRRGWLRRAVEVSLPDGPHLVEYDGKGIGYECVSADGEVIRKTSGRWFVPHFEFQLGGWPTVVEVQVWPWLALRSLILRVGDRVVYAEGEGKYQRRIFLSGGR